MLWSYCPRLAKTATSTDYCTLQSVSGQLRTNDEGNTPYNVPNEWIITKTMKGKDLDHATTTTLDT